MQPISHVARRGAGLLFLLLPIVLFACGSGSGEAEAGAEHASDSHPVRIAQGAEVELTEHLASGEITVFDFMSDYCPPCKQIAPFLNRLHNERDDLTVVKVDINRPGQRGIDWRSPVAQQYGLRSIPHFMVYDAEGELLAEGPAAQQLVFGWLNELEPQEG